MTFKYEQHGTTNCYRYCTDGPNGGKCDACKRARAVERAKSAERRNAKRRTPQYRAKRNAKLQVKYANPEHKAQRRVRREARLASDPTYKPRLRVYRENLLASNPEYRQRQRDSKVRVLRYKARKFNAPGVANKEQLDSRIAYYGGRCWMCGALATDMDHVKPLARGGSNWPANLRPACGSCNGRKQHRWHGPAWAHELRRVA